MPGQMLAEFNNELRYSPRPGIRVIDVLLDVILPELAGQGVPSALLDAELVERVVAGSYFDDEAEFVLSQTRDNRLPVTPFPTGGELRDVTWAFNQATGARPERWEVNEALAAGQGGVFDPELGRFRRPRDGEIATVVLDPLTGEPVYPINEALPSLQRLPGIIFVPAGLFPICGTITLFGGQQLVGVSASGSVLLKYGDGPCVRTQHPANLVDDRHMTAERAARTRLTPGEEGRGRIDAILRRFDEDWRAEVAGGDEAPEAHFAQTAWWSAGPDVRREVVERQLVSTEFTGYASVRVASLAIEQRDWRSGVATLEARLPVEDELADPRAPVGFFDEAEGLRVGPLLHSSVGVDLVGCGFSVVEDVAVRGFRRGAGIRSQPRALPGGSQFAYINQVRHCHVRDCHVGILLPMVLGLKFGRENEARRAEGMLPSFGGPNSTLIFDCRVEATVSEPAARPSRWPAADGRPRAGIEGWGETMSVVSSHVQMPPSVELGGVVSWAGHLTLYHSGLVGGRHVLCAPLATFKVVPPEAAVRPMQRVTDRTGLTRTLFHNRFADELDQPVAPRVEVIEQNSDLPRFEARGDAEVAGLAGARPHWYADASDTVVNDVSPQVNLELASEVRSLQTGWTSANLLENSTFRMGSRGSFPTPLGWRWRQDGSASEPGMEVRLVELDEPAFTGTAVEVRIPAHVEVDRATIRDGRGVLAKDLRGPRLRLEQVLVPAVPGPETPAAERGPAFMAAWAARSRIQGGRVLGGIWAWTNQPGRVAVGFHQEEDATGLAAWRPEAWLFLTAVRVISDVSLPDWSPRGGGRERQLRRFGLTFFVELKVPRVVDGPAIIRFGAPQVTLGPDLFPVGPAPAASRVYGDVQLARGFQKTWRIEVGPAGSGSTLIGLPVAMEQIRVMPGASMGGGATVCVELLRGGKAGSASRWTGAEELACYRVAKGEVAVVRPFEAPRDLKPGDLIVARRMGGTDAVDVYLHGVHSRVV